MKPDLRCYYHPDREATSQCDRCGDYLCAECMQELEAEYLCRTCYQIATCQRGHAEEPNLSCGICGTTLCSKCVIKAEGMAYCHRCLDPSLREEEPGAARRDPARLWLLYILLIVLAIACIMLVLREGS